MEWPGSLARAVRFLTLLPIPASDSDTAHGVSGSLHLFPVVGLIVGGISAGAGAIALYLFGSPVHAALAVAVSAVVTAGFHLDGLADTCDALFSWRDRARKLEIMKDSRIGAMGAIALVLVLALKISALLALGEEWWVGALLCPVFGRWADVYGIAMFPAAKHEGLASDVHESVGGRAVIGATVPIILAAGFLMYLGDWYTVAVSLAAAYLAIHGFASAVSNSLGGLTGDVYGAMSEIGEVAVLLAMCVALS